MYLTKINLDLKKPETSKAFYDRGRFHSLVESSFPGERQMLYCRCHYTSGRV